MTNQKELLFSLFTTGIFCQSVGVEFLGKNGKPPQYMGGDKVSLGSLVSLAGDDSEWVGVKIKEKATSEEVCCALERLIKAIRERSNFAHGDDDRIGFEIDCR